MYYDQLKYMLHSEELCIDRIGFVIIIPYTCYSSYIRFPFIQEERNVSIERNIYLDTYLNNNTLISYPIHSGKN